MIDNTNSSKTNELLVDISCEDTIRERFDTLLLHNKMKQIDLANRLSVDKALICRIVNGKEIPCADLRLKIASILGVDSFLIWRGYK